MSVLIKGIEMPKSCDECQLTTQYYDGGMDVCCPLDKYVLPSGSKRDDCPLTEVPPHGRLIDADAVQEDWYRLNFDRKITDGTLAYWNFQLSKAPTVIEADSHSERELQRDYEASVEYAQHCGRYEPTYDPETGAM